MHLSKHEKSYLNIFYNTKDNNNIKPSNRERYFLNL